MKRIVNLLRRKPAIVLALGTIWFVSVIGGMLFLLNYSTRPGRFSLSPSRWPEQTMITLDENMLTLLIFVHPRCSCSKASVGELSEILARVGSKLKTYVVFVKPPSMPTDWEKESLWRQAKALPGANVILDEGGVEAKRFRAETSGLTLIYGANRQLLFSGGITAARGHSGDSLGKSAVISLVNTGKMERPTAFVFGCSLFGSTASGQKFQKGGEKHDPTE